MSGNTATPFQRPETATTDWMALQFMIVQRLMRVQTVTLVEVQAVYGGGLGPVGTVDVQPLVDQVDGAGNAVPLAVIYGRPYVRWCGGQSAIILDPQEDDIGVMCFASRDISSVIANQGQEGPPPSGRVFSFSDGLYLGSIPLGVTPQQYVQFLVNDDGDPNGITITSINGPVTINGVTIDTSGNITTSGTVKGGDCQTSSGISLKNHVHLYTPGTGTPTDTGAPSG